MDASILAGDTAIEADFAFHRSISAATGNPYFEKFMHSLGSAIIPPRSIRPQSETPEQRQLYLEQIQAEHRRIYQASSGAMPRPRASLCANIWREAGSATAERSTLLYFQCSVERPAMALPASLQMLTQSEARALGIPPLDRLIIAPVLRLDLLQIKPALFRGFRLRTD